MRALVFLVKKQPQMYTLPAIVFWSLIVWCIALVSAAIIIARFR